MGVGIDLAPIKPFRKIQKGDYRYWQRVFSKKEWISAFRDKNSAPHLAGMFVIKEAAMKATGKTGAKNFRNFEISYGKAGEPNINIKGLYISVSHAGEYVVAIAIRN